MIKWFEEIGAGDRNFVGSKGYNLGILMREGFNVPNGFVITTEGVQNWNEETKKIVLSAFNNLENKRVAVRSSGRNEFCWTI